MTDPQAAMAFSLIGLYEKNGAVTVGGALGIDTPGEYIARLKTPDQTQAAQVAERPSRFGASTESQLTRRGRVSQARVAANSVSERAGQTSGRVTESAVANPTVQASTSAP